MKPTAQPETVRLFLLGLSEAFARSLARYVSGEPRVALTGVAPSVVLGRLLLRTTTLQAELVLIDWAALNGSPRDAAHALRLGCSGLRIVCVASEGEPYRAAAAQAGADAVISKDGFAAELEPLLRGFFPERFGKAEDQNA